MAPAHVRSLWDTARSAVGSITQLAASRLRPAFPLVPLPTAPAAHSLHTPCFQPAPARGALPKALPRPCIMHPHLPFASQTTLLLNRATAAWVHSQAAVMPLLCLRPRGTGTWRADAAESVASDQQRRWAATKRTSARASGGPAPQRTLLVHHRSQRASLLHEAVRLVETATGRRCALTQHMYCYSVNNHTCSRNRCCAATVRWACCRDCWVAQVLLSDQLCPGYQ